MSAIIRVHEHSTKAELEAAIHELRARQGRLPQHWVDQRAELGDEIDCLVDRWLTTSE